MPIKLLLAHIGPPFAKMPEGTAGPPFGLTSVHPHDMIGTAVLDRIVSAPSQFKGHFVANGYSTNENRLLSLVLRAAISCESSAQVMEFLV